LANESSGVSGLAERYARALFELADEAKALDAVAGDLRTLRRLLDASEDLRRLIASPRLPRGEQARALEAVLGEAGVGELTRRFVAVVARNRRLAALRAMIGGYLGELARRRGEVTAQVTAARELSPAQQEELTASLRRMVGAKVGIDVRVDPALIGGLVVRVGSKMVDSSVRSKLQRLQIALRGA
jgi:F-type H+-transporting ATPase subunit delta